MHLQSSERKITIMNRMRRFRKVFIDKAETSMHPLSIVCSAAIVLLCCWTRVHCDESTTKINLQEVVDGMTDEQKQTIYQLLLSASSNQGRQDNTHWCCSIDPGNLTAVTNESMISCLRCQVSRLHHKRVRRSTTFSVTHVTNADTAAVACSVGQAARVGVTTIGRR